MTENLHRQGMRGYLGFWFIWLIKLNLSELVLVGKVNAVGTIYWPSLVEMQKFSNLDCQMFLFYEPNGLDSYLERDEGGSRGSINVRLKV